MREAQADFWFHLAASGLKKASGMMLRLALVWTEAGVQTVSLV